ncbi:TIR domain-containing protein [Streptomyces sp. NPDC088788]|uniref:TIR domain-containing protein n=1 Tax=Streptomyces sp. NPDC088788 TaxID=3365898 RepID=UPI0037F5F4B3
MKVFISWSGPASQRCAEALRKWLPFMNQAIAPFTSSQDISKGERGLNKIANQLKECNFGVICVTRENQGASWINFESGALSRELGENSVAPFLLDMQIKELSGPLTQFQATDSSNKEDVWAMVKSINEKCEATLELEMLRTTFDRFWQDLESDLTKIRENHPQSDIPERDTQDILNELVGLVREQNSRISVLENAVRSDRKSVHYTINEPQEIRIIDEDAPSNNKRVAATVARARKLIGEEHVKHVSRGRHSIVVSVTSEGLTRAQGVARDLESLAASNNTGIDILCESENETLSYPPF